MVRGSGNLLAGGKPVFNFNFEVNEVKNVIGVLSGISLLAASSGSYAGCESVAHVLAVSSFSDGVQFIYVSPTNSWEGFYNLGTVSPVISLTATAALASGKRVHFSTFGDMPCAFNTFNGEISRLVGFNE